MDDEDRDDELYWAVVNDPTFDTAFDRLTPYVAEDGGYGWIDPTLTPEQVAETERLRAEALAHLRARTGHLRSR